VVLLLSMDRFSGCWKILCIFTGWFRGVSGSWSRVLSVLLFYWTNRRWQNHSALLQMGGITRARWSHVAHAHIGSLVSGFVIVVILRSPEFILGRSIILLSLLIHSPVSLNSFPCLSCFIFQDPREPLCRSKSFDLFLFLLTPHNMSSARDVAEWIPSGTRCGVVARYRVPFFSKVNGLLVELLDRGEGSSTLCWAWRTGLHGSGLHGSGLHGSGLHGSGLHGSGLHGSGLCGS